LKVFRLVSLSGQSVFVVTVLNIEACGINFAVMSSGANWLRLLFLLYQVLLNKFTLSSILRQNSLSFCFFMYELLIVVPNYGLSRCDLCLFIGWTICFIFVIESANLNLSCSSLSKSFKNLKVCILSSFYVVIKFKSGLLRRRPGATDFIFEGVSGD